MSSIVGHFLFNLDSLHWLIRSSYLATFLSKASFRLSSHSTSNMTTCLVESEQRTTSGFRWWWKCARGSLAASPSSQTYSISVQFQVLFVLQLWQIWWAWKNMQSNTVHKISPAEMSDRSNIHVQLHVLELRLKMTTETDKFAEFTHLRNSNQSPLIYQKCCCQRDVMVYSSYQWRSNTFFIWAWLGVQSCWFYHNGSV